MAETGTQPSFAIKLFDGLCFLNWNEAVIGTRLEVITDDQSEEDEADEAANFNNKDVKT